MTGAELDAAMDWNAFYGHYVGKYAPAGQHKMHACCPFHKESHPSFWWNTENGCWKCEAGCGSGNATGFLARVEHIDTREAWRKLCDMASLAAGTKGTKPQEAKAKAVRLPLTLAQYAEGKRLPMSFLQGLGLRDAPEGLPHVQIPYYDEGGQPCAVKQRFHPENTQRFGWVKGGTVTLYGLWLRLNREAGRLILAEGESDAQSCWVHEVPCLGVPGASGFQAQWTPLLRDRDVYLHIEPDRGGETFLRKTVETLRAGGYRGTVRAFRASEDGGCKDLSDLHLCHGDAFQAHLTALLDKAETIDLAAGAPIGQAVPQAAPAPPVAPPLEIYRAAELYGKRIERPPVIIRGLLPAGLTVLAGAPKRGKSWMALKMGLCVAAGEPFLGMQTMQGDVLYLDLESRQYRIQSRLSKLLPGRAPEGLYVTHACQRLDEHLLEQLTAWVRSVEHPVLIIIDTLGRVKGGSRKGENAYENDTRIYGQLQEFAMKNRLAVVGVHHLKKAGMGDADYFERVSGSMGLTGVCDAVMVLDGKRGEEDSTLHVSSRDFEGMDLVVGFDNGCWRLKATDSEAYREEKAYTESPVVRGLIRLCEGRGRWEGSPTQLLEELQGLAPAPIDIRPTQMSIEISKVQARLCEQDGIQVSWRRSGPKGRIVTLERVDPSGF